MKSIENLILVKPQRKENVRDDPRIKQWVERFREEREFDGIKPSTIRNDILRITIFLDFVYNRLNKEPDKLVNSDFVRFFNYLERERKLSRNTQDKYFQLLKVFYRLARLQNFRKFAEESSERKRFRRYEVKHYDAVDGGILNEILQKILSSNSRTNIRNSLIIRMLWDTGCRVSELLNIRYKDCDFEEGTFRIRNTKGKEERIVVCSNDTLEALRYYIQYNIDKSPDAPIFQTVDGKQINRNTITHVFSNVIKELKKEGKIPQNKRIVLHSLRHGRAVDLLNKGVPLDVVKEVLGHKSIDTTLFYSHSNDRANSMLKDIKKLL
nr:site-specific integrase [Methanothermococcus okinawensis]